jgi:hypothetical protein
MTGTGTRLEQAEARLDRAQVVLDAIGKVLATAEKTQAASERVHTGLRTTNGLLVVAVIVAGVLVLGLRRRL